MNDANPHLPAPPRGGAVRPDWLDRRVEPILEPDLPIVDSLHHLWLRHGWRYLTGELSIDLASGHNIVATVYVQARSMYRLDGPAEMRPVGESEFANGAAAMFASGALGPTRACAAIVGHVDLMLGSRVEPVLEAHLRAAGDRLRGIRHITTWDADSSINNPDYPSPSSRLADKTFRDGIAVLHRFGLSFDAMLYHPQIPDLTALAASFPDMRFVLDHTGIPLGIGVYRGRHNEVFSAWAASIRALAIHPNVFVKLGGLGIRYTGLAFDDHPEPPSSELLAGTFRPYFETCIEAFGPSRCMFESNFPVDKVSYSYPVFWNACKRIVKGASADEKAELFTGAASRFYRLSHGLPTPVDNRW